MNRFFAILLFIGLASCQPEGRVYVEHEKLSPDVEWKKEDVRTFEVPILQAGQIYDMSMSYRFANGYQFPVANIMVVETSPSGIVTEYFYNLKVRDVDGYIGEPGYDIWDSEHLVAPSKVFPESGTYTYVVSHEMEQDPLNFAMEIGIVLDEVK